jgi:acyl-coenzyme A thioesterase PaaI-like protein
MIPIFKTNKKTSEESQNLERMFNQFPAFKVTGGEIIFVSNDFLEVHLRFNLSETTINYHKTAFGGAIYSSLDPVYPLQLIHILGDANFVVWDLSATIDYLKPIDRDVYAKFLLSNEQINEIKINVKNKNKSVITLPVEYQDLDGNIYAKATKTIYIADRAYFENKNK